MNIDWLSLSAAKQQLPAEQYALLADNGSLTRRVRDGCSGYFEVQLIDHKTVQPDFGEQALLALPDSARALSRQVFLCCDGQAVIYARTIVGLLEKNQTLLDRIDLLGSASLGSILFRNPLAIKTRMDLASLPIDHEFFGSIKLDSVDIQTHVWVRRSLYDYHGCELIVYEAFIAYP